MGFGGLCGYAASGRSAGGGFVAGELEGIVVVLYGGSPFAVGIYSAKYLSTIVL